VKQIRAVQAGTKDRQQSTMKSAARVCAKCGAAIFADAPHGFCSVCLLRTGLGVFADGEDERLERSAPMVMEFGDYELLEEIGRGGQGVVYRARQKSLNRTVALKVLALGPLATETHIKRFRQEAEAAASLEHPCIVPIYEIGERDGSCYFSMKFVDGGQLDEVVRREPMSIRRTAELIAKLARTVHYAHQRGILHRDIKPGNILLDRQSEPHLTDFGLARLVENESTITRTMEVFGTPSYMAPEQAAGHNKQLTTAADIFGLGAVAYHLLTGQPPFAGGTTYETIKLVLESSPRRPSLLNRNVNRDLEIICLKCLEKEPGKRYSSAKSLADDLDRFLRDEPIASRRVSRTERMWRWCKRKPVVAGLSAALVLVLLGGFASVIWELHRAEQGELIARRNLYCADMNLAYQAWEEGNLQRAQSLLRAHLPERGREDLRGFEWRYLWQLFRDESLTTFANANFTAEQVDGIPERHLVLTGDGHTLITASGSKLRWIDIDTQRELKTLNADGVVRTLATARNRPDLLAYAADKIHCISTNGETMLGGGVAYGPCSTLELSPDGTLLAAGMFKRALPAPMRLFDVKTGKQLAEYVPKGRAATSLGFSPDGKYLVCGAVDFNIDILEVPTLRLLKSTERQGGWVNALAFDHAGTRLASAGNTATIVLWNFPEMSEITRLEGHRGRISDLAFGPNDQTLVSAAGDQTLRMWDLNRPGVHTILRGHRGGVGSVLFSADGKELYSSSYDDTIKVWHSDFAESRDVLRQSSFLRGLSFSPDGRLLAAADYFGRTAVVWDVTKRRRLEQSIGKHSGIMQRVAFSPDGKLLATGGEDDEVQLWDFAKNRTAFVFPKARHMFQMAFHPVEPLLAIAADNVRFWNTETGEETKPLSNAPGHGATRIAFSPDGKWIAVGMMDGRVALQRLDGKAARTFHEHRSVLMELCFSRDSTLLASGERGNRIALYDVRRQQTIRTFAAHADAIWSMAFALDGKTLVSVSSDQTIKFWRVADQQLALTLRLDSGPVIDMAFSPTGDLMATSGTDNTLRFWPAPSLAEIDAAEKRAQR
jgi:eukaryotic-like serine/threonine-protein kinase